MRPVDSARTWSARCAGRVREARPERALVGQACRPVAALAQPRRRAPSRSPSRPTHRPQDRSSARCSRSSCTGAAGSRLVVKVAGDRRRRPVDEDEREVGAARGLDAGAHAGDPEAARQTRRLARRPGSGTGRDRREAASAAVAQGASGSCSSPAVSGRPRTTLKAWTACPAAPLTRLSITETATIRPVRSSRCTWTRQWLLPGPGPWTAAARRPRRRARPRRRRRTGRASSLAVTSRVGRTCDDARMPRVMGMRWGRKSTVRGARVRARGR